jgi:hypothetical protein
VAAAVVAGVTHGEVVVVEFPAEEPPVALELVDELVAAEQSTVVDVVVSAGAVVLVVLELAVLVALVVVVVLLVELLDGAVEGVVVVVVVVDLRDWVARRCGVPVGSAELSASSR